MDVLPSWLSSGVAQTLLIVILPFAYTKGRQGLAAVQRWRNRPAEEKSPASAYRVSLLVLLLIYSLFRALLVRPINLFDILDLPLNVSPHALQTALAQRVGLNDATHRLLAKLGTVEGRLAYIRLGAGPLVQCTFCRSYPEQVLFSLPTKLGSYTFAATIVGLLASHRWRNTLATFLISSFLLELGVLLFADGFTTLRSAPLAVYLHLARHAFFIVCGGVAYVTGIEERAKPDALVSTIVELGVKADVTSQRLRAAIIQRAALARDGQLRSAIMAAGAELQRQAEANAEATRTQAVAVRLDVHPEGERRREMERIINFALSQPPPPGAVHARPAA